MGDDGHQPQGENGPREQDQGGREDEDRVDAAQPTGRGPDGGAVRPQLPERDGGEDDEGDVRARPRRRAAPVRACLRSVDARAAQQRTEQHAGQQDGGQGAGDPHERGEPRVDVEAAASLGGGDGQRAVRRERQERRHGCGDERDRQGLEAGEQQQLPVGGAAGRHEGLLGDPALGQHARREEEHRHGERDEQQGDDDEGHARDLEASGGRVDRRRETRPDVRVQPVVRGGGGQVLLGSSEPVAQVVERAAARARSSG